MRARRRVGAVVAILALTFGGASAASADCLSVEASYRILGGNRAYVVGPKRCVVNTQYREGLHVPFTVEPAGTGVSGGVWVPMP